MLRLQSGEWFASIARLVVVASSLAVAACAGPDPGALTSSTGTLADAPMMGQPAGAPPAPGAPGTTSDPASKPAPTAPAAPPPPRTPLAKGISVSEVGVFQGVKVSVSRMGVPVTNRPAQVVAGRDALLRVYVDTDPSFESRSLTAELRLVDAAGAEQIMLDARTIAGPSTDDDLASTFDFDVTGDKLPVGVRYSVAITDTTLSGDRDKASSAARSPADGSLEILDARRTGGLQVQLVPVQYNADGSGRLPDTSSAQVELYRQTIFALYPVTSVDISVLAPFPWSTAIAANGDGWSSILQAMVALRQRNGAAPDVYYMGIFAPADTFNKYCGASCTTGLSGVLDNPLDSVGRASIAVGFTGALAAQTAAHELGHAHGRLHSPCGGATHPDPAYPYTDGSIGVWGYDLVAKQLVSPSLGKDVMSYCQPAWISDFTYDALFNRVATVNSSLSRLLLAQTAQPAQYRMLGVEADGSLRWGESLMLAEPPSNAPRTVHYLDAGGAPVATVTGHFYAYEGLPGGYVLVPEGPAGVAKIVVDLPAGLGARELIVPAP